MTKDKSREFLYYYRIFAPNGPEPVAEYPFSKVIGRRHRFDWAWPEENVAVEVDGGVWKPGGGRHGSDTDREKMNIACSLGWFVFHFSPAMLKSKPDVCISFVTNALKK